MIIILTIVTIVTLATLIARIALWRREALWSYPMQQENRTIDLNQFFANQGEKK